MSMILTVIKLAVFLLGLYAVVYLYLRLTNKSARRGRKGKKKGIGIQSDKTPPSS